MNLSRFKKVNNAVHLENLSSLIESKGGKQSRLIGIAGRKKLSKSKDKNYKSAQAAQYDTYGIVKHPNVSKSNWTAKQYEATHKSKANPTGKVDTSKWTKPEQKKVDTSKWVKPKPKPPPAPKTKPKTVQKPPPAPSKNNDDYKKQSTGKSPVYDGNDVSNPSFGLSAESKAKQASKYMQSGYGATSGGMGESMRESTDASARWQLTKLT